MHFLYIPVVVSVGSIIATFALPFPFYPFIYFPIKGHCEQEQVSRILTQHGAGSRLTLSETTPEFLAEKFRIGKKEIAIIEIILFIATLHKNN